MLIEEAHMNNQTSPIFKLAELSQLYNSRKEVKHNGRVHTIRLNKKLLDHFPNMCTQNHLRDVLLAFNENFGNILSKACQRDRDLNAACLALAAEIVRRYTIEDAKVFDVFPAGCQQDPVPPMLFVLDTDLGRSQYRAPE